MCSGFATQCTVPHKAIHGSLLTGRSRQTRQSISLDRSEKRQFLHALMTGADFKSGKCSARISRLSASSERGSIADHCLYAASFATSAAAAAPRRGQNDGLSLIRTARDNKSLVFEPFQMKSDISQASIMSSSIRSFLPIGFSMPTSVFNKIT